MSTKLLMAVVCDSTPPSRHRIIKNMAALADSPFSVHWAFVAYDGGSESWGDVRAKAQLFRQPIRLLENGELGAYWSFWHAKRHHTRLQLSNYHPKLVYQRRFVQVLHGTELLWLVDNDITYSSAQLHALHARWQCAFAARGPPLVSQPLIDTDTQDFWSLLASTWAPGGELGDVQDSLGAEVGAAESSFVEMQAPLLHAGFFRWLMQRVGYDLALAQDLLHSDVGLDFCWCTAARDFARVVLRQPTRVGCAVLVTPVAHANAKQIQKSREYMHAAGPMWRLVHGLHPQWYHNPLGHFVEEKAASLGARRGGLCRRRHCWTASEGLNYSIERERALRQFRSSAVRHVQSCSDTVSDDVGSSLHAKAEAGGLYGASRHTSEVMDLRRSGAALLDQAKRQAQIQVFQIWVGLELSPALGLLSCRNAQWAWRHNYQYTLFDSLSPGFDAAASWHKVPRILSLLRPPTNLVVYLDMDLQVIDMDRTVEQLLQGCGRASLVLTSDSDFVQAHVDTKSTYIPGCCGGNCTCLVNGGMLIVRNTLFARKLLRDMIVSPECAPFYQKRQWEQECMHILLRRQGHMPEEEQLRHMLTNAAPNRLLPQLGPSGEVCVLPQPLVAPLLPQRDGALVGNSFTAEAGAISRSLLENANLVRRRPSPLAAQVSASASRHLPFSAHAVQMYGRITSKERLVSASLGKADLTLYPAAPRSDDGMCTRRVLHGAAS